MLRGWGRAVVRARLFFPIEMKLGPRPTQQGPLGAHSDPRVLEGWREVGGCKSRTYRAVFQAPVLNPPPLRPSSPPLGTRRFLRSPGALVSFAAVVLSHRTSSSARTTLPRVRQTKVPAVAEGAGSHLPRNVLAEGLRWGPCVAAAWWARGSERVRLARRLISNSCLVRASCSVFSRWV